MNRSVLDVRRLLCPLPVIRTQDRVRDLAPGERLEIRCTDPGVRHDIPAWCRMYGHRVIGIRETAGEIAITIEVVSDEGHR
ncbi:sulfurtransferase TusA [bacterium BMS3Bbin12]|nr:sulfurtransferase TusA [bacterium BMS3Abin12]GBE48892.1 sulfurtransferase TusA [bacterium BMS3Bbin12]GBE49796.1 sulfurtransferase TusA [bacterium BMS3Bbin13]